MLIERIVASLLTMEVMIDASWFTFSFNNFHEIDLVAPVFTLMDEARTYHGMPRHSGVHAIIHQTICRMTVCVRCPVDTHVYVQWVHVHDSRMHDLTQVKRGGGVIRHVSSHQYLIIQRSQI